MAAQQPLTTVNKLAAETSAGIAGQNNCYYGQKLSSGATAASGQLYQITSYAKAVELFGNGSHLAENLAKVFDIANLAGFKVGKPFPTIYAIGLSDPSTGVKATATITSSGNLTSAGVFSISIGDKIKHTYKVSLGSTATVQQQYTAIVEAINADASCPVVASSATVNSLAVVKLEHKHKGLVGNDTYIQIHTPSVGGSTFSTTAFTGGQGEPTLTNVATPLQNIRMHNIIYPSCWNRDLITAFVKNSWNVDGSIKDTMLFYGKIASVSSIETAVADNHQTICPFYTKLIDEVNFKGSVHSTYVDAIPAIFATIFSLCVTSGSNLVNFIANGLTTGTPHYNAVPVFNTIIPSSILTAVDPVLDITDEEEVLLRGYCYNTFRNNRADNGLLTRPVVTTYKTNELGYADTAFKYIEQVKTTSVCAEYIFEAMLKRFAKVSVTTGMAQVGSSQVTIDEISAFIVMCVEALIAMPYGLIRAGALEDIVDKINSSAVLNIKDGSYATNIIGAVVMQLRQLDVNFYTTTDYTENEI